jgi:hypothetical protein
MRIFQPVLTVWSKQTAYAAQGINHVGLCFVHRENIATPSTVRAASSQISQTRWTEIGPCPEYPIFAPESDRSRRCRETPL